MKILIVFSILITSNFGWSKQISNQNRIDQKDSLIIGTWCFLSSEDDILLLYKPPPLMSQCTGLTFKATGQVSHFIAPNIFGHINRRIIRYQLNDCTIEFTIITLDGCIEIEIYEIIELNSRRLKFKKL